MLYCNPAPSGEVTVIVPVGVVQVGCTGVMEGAAGTGGAAFIVTGKPTDVQVPLVTVTVCGPAGTLGKTGLVW